MLVRQVGHQVVLRSAAVVAVRLISPLRRWNTDCRNVTPITPGTASALRCLTSEPAG